MTAMLGAISKPRKLTPQVQDKIVRLLKCGNAKEVAARASGVCTTTFYNWMRAGEREPFGPCHDFYHAVSEAVAIAESDQVAIIRKAAEKSWQAAAWLLERKYPARWGRRQAVEVTRTKQQPLTRERAEQLTDEELEDIIRRGVAAIDERTRPRRPRFRRRRRPGQKKIA